MTATDPRTLDDLLAAAQPVDADPFDLGALLSDLRIKGRTWDEQYATTEMIARHANAERVSTENARRWAVTLEQECADKDRRIADAVRWLELAASFSVTEDCDAAIHDAMAALRGAE